jgi:hypothetical protein
VHNALRDLFNLEHGVFPGLRAGQDVASVLEKGRRKLVVSPPVTIEARAMALLNVHPPRHAENAEAT